MTQVEHKVYSSRWLVLLTVAALNTAINTLVYSYSSVATAAAVYYQKEPSDIDLLTTIALVASLIAALVSTWMVERIGLRLTVIIAGTLALVGGAVRMLSTFPGINDSLSLDAQFTIGLIAQFTTGLANPLAFCLPTKVAVDWFPHDQAPLASGMILLSFIFGLTIATGLNPFIFADPDYIQWMNITYFIPAVIAFLFSIFFVKTDRPPSPPTNSADLEIHTHLGYFEKLKALLTNPRYVLLMFTIGGVQGFLNGLISRVYQMSCAVGYDEDITGVGVICLLVFGLVGAFGATMIFRRTGLVEEQAKITFAIAALISIPILYLLLVPDEEVWMTIMLSLAGLLSFGMLPLGVELILENTFPIDPATGLILMFMTSTLTGVVIIALGGAMEQELSASQKELEVCTDIGGALEVFEAKDHTNFVIFMMCFVTTLAVSFIVLLRSKYKRTRVDREGDKEYH